MRQTAATESQFVSVQRVKEYCDLVPTTGSRKPVEVAKPEFDSNLPSPHYMTSYNIAVVYVAPAVEFRNVFMKYEYGPLSLRDVSFVINPGERVGVVGRTG